MSNRYLYRKNNEKSEVKDVGLPSNIDDLVTLLDETFPLVNPTPTASISDIQRKAGQRDVVDWLLELKNRKDNNVLGK